MTQAQIKRNAMRLTSHVDCYTKCGFIMDFISKDNLGVPNNGWSLGLTSLLPDFVDYVIDSIFSQILRIMENSRTMIAS